jgi:molybdopterin molybdotransferase
MLSYVEARKKVIEVLSSKRGIVLAERVALGEALGRVLTEEVAADRDYPPFDRSTRDGYAVRSDDAQSLPVRSRVAAEIKAGDVFTGQLAAGHCVSIMTGAAVPAGADAVVMLEHVKREGESIVISQAVERGQNIVPRGSESKAGQVLLRAGVRLGYAELTLLAQVGRAEVSIARRPRVAILSTGNEVVEINEPPGPFEIRNSNTVSLAAQVALAGGEAVALRNARDETSALRAQIERGLQEDALALSGGVSAGKYDLVEAVLRKLGAEFHFDAVAIRPGRPAVFATCQNKFVFGLPGNPVSTMVTFELFVAPALALLSGAPAPPLQFLKAKLAAAVPQKTKLTLFLPARLEGQGNKVTVHALPWHGSGDVVALAHANCTLVVPDNVSELVAGAWVDVLPRRG